MSSQNRPANDSNEVLNLFCSEEGDVWRVHVWPAWIPPVVSNFVDRDGEAYPVILDFDDLSGYMADDGHPFEKRVARTGGVELSAEGPAATALAVWLSTALASGVRAPGSGGDPK